MKGLDLMINKEVAINKKHNIYIYKINQLSCMLICTWMTLPFFRVRAGVLGLLIFFIIWLISTDLKWLVKKWSLDIVFVFIFFITLIPYLISGNSEKTIWGPNTILVNFPLFFLGMFINHYYMYYKKDYKTLGKIGLVSLTMYVVGSLQTYIGLLNYPMASRELSGSIVNNPEMGILYTQLGIGGFGHVYGACFVLIAALYPLIKDVNLVTKKHKIISIISIVVMLLMIVKASYAIALIIVLSGIILVLVFNQKKKFAFFMILSILFLMMVPTTLIGESLLKVAYVFRDNQTISSKIMDVSGIFLYDLKFGEITSRIYLYSASLVTFLKQPIFGVQGPTGVSQNIGRSVVGGHSGWLDLLALYGLFAGVPLFISLYFNFRKHLQFYKKNIYRGFIIVIYFLFFTFGVINPLFTIYEIGFAVFFIVPAIPFLPYSFKLSSISVLNIS